METTLSGSLVMKERKKERKRESLDIVCLLNKGLEGRAKGDSESMIGIEVLEEAGGVAEEHMQKGGKILCRRPQGS